MTNSAINTIIKLRNNYCLERQINNGNNNSKQLNKEMDYLGQCISYSNEK